MSSFLSCWVAVGQNQWYHFGIGAPPVLEPILVVGLGCSLGYDLDLDPWPGCLVSMALTAQVVVVSAFSDADLLELPGRSERRFGGRPAEAPCSGERKGWRPVCFCRRHMAGQSQWYHFGVGAPHILVYFSGDWDVHWGYGILTHGHMAS